MAKNRLTTNYCPITLDKDSGRQKRNSPTLTNQSLQGYRVGPEETGETTNLPRDNYDPKACVTDARSLITHLGTVQVLVFLQEFIRLLYCHFIVAIIKVVWRSITESC